METLAHTSMVGGLLFVLVSAILFFKKNLMWKNFAIGALLCFILFLSSLVLGPKIDDISKKQEMQKPVAQLIQYNIQSVNASSDRQLKSWRKGELAPLTYNIFVEKSNPTEAEFERIAQDIVEKDAKNRQNWNIIYFYLKTPEGLKTGVAYMFGMYAVNGHPEQSNKLKPGDSSNRFKFVIKND